ncbi:pogo transposable element with KRAB domain [Trichonephila clavipes]|nr:pogo transposable element with KRAB domain [Trichonephila clavipes]
MDEVPLTFDLPTESHRRYLCGVKTVSITTTGQEKTHFTVMLACCADSTKLKLLLIFKRKTIPKENFPPSVVIWCNEKGWCDEDIMLDWFQEVWKKREGAFFNSKGVLIMDSIRAHIKDSLKAEAKKKHRC